MKKSELRKLIREELVKEMFTPTSDTVMIMIGDEGKYYPWYLKKAGDSTHFSMFNSDKYLNDKRLEQGRHIGEFKGESYYDDIRKWLKGAVTSKQLNGKKYKGLG